MEVYDLQSLRRALALIDEVIDLSVKIHMDLGSGLLESGYNNILSSILRQHGHLVTNEVPIKFEYAGITIENDYRLDLLVDNILQIELKAVEKMIPAHYKQALTYTKILNHPIGLLVNFGGDQIPGNFTRILNKSHPLAKEYLKEAKGFWG